VSWMRPKIIHIILYKPSLHLLTSRFLVGSSGNSVRNLELLIGLHWAFWSTILWGISIALVAILYMWAWAKTNYLIVSTKITKQ
jgi:hypothetical protein